jgi:hypothetical protein
LVVELFRVLTDEELLMEDNDDIICSF